MADETRKALLPESDALEVVLSRATATDETTLQNLMQLYTYEFSDLLDLDVREDGLFPPRSLISMWTNPIRTVLFLRTRSKLAGFAIVDKRSRLSENPAAVDMAEFFVLRRYRHQGFGQRAAHLLFDLFPGAWEVRQVPNNSAATAFWRKVIGRYTDDRFREVPWDDARWRGPVQFFDNTAVKT